MTTKTMLMRCNEDLYELIKSLSKAEKRYFKLYATQYTKSDSSNYVLLFDAIDRQEIYNENKLRKKFRNHKFGTNLAKTKYLLYELILRTIRQLYDKRTAQSKIDGLLHSTRYLKGKGLYEQASINLQKAKRLCIAYENQTQHLEVLELERELIGYADKDSNVIRSMRRWLEEYRALTLLHSRETAYKALLVESSILFESSLNYQLEEITFAYEVIINDPLIQLEEKALTFLSKVCYYKIRAQHAQVVQQYEKAAFYLDELWLLWEANQDKKVLYQDTFVRFGMLYMNCCAAARKRGKYYEAILVELNNLEVLYPGEDKKYQFIACSLDFIFNLTLNNLESCNLQLFTIRDYLKDDGIELLDKSTLINLYFHLGIFYFLTGEYGETQSWIRKIQQEDGKCDYPNIQNYCRLLSLMARYEEREFDLLEYDVLTAHRFLRKRQQVKPIETLVLSSVKQLLKIRHNREAIDIFVDFHSSLRDMEEGWMMPLQMTVGSAFYRWVRNKLPGNKNSDIN